MIAGFSLLREFVLDERVSHSFVEGLGAGSTLFRCG